MRRELLLIIRLRDQASQALKRVAANLKRVDTQTKRTTQANRSFGVSMNFTFFQLLRLGGALAGVRLGISVMATSVIGLRNAIIQTNAQLETATLQFKTLMGSAKQAEKHVRSLFDFARTTPFTTTEVIEASRLLLTFGGEALNTREILRLIGDAAAATGSRFRDLGFWIGRMFSALRSGRPFGEAAARLQELAVLSPEVRNEMERMSKAGADAADIWVIFQKDLEKFSGATVEMAKTWVGVTSTFLDSTRLMVAEGFKPLFDAIKGVIAASNEWIASGGPEFSERLSGAVTGTGRAIKAFTGEIQRLVRGFQVLPKVIQLVVVALAAWLLIGPRVVATVRALAFAVVGLNAAITTTPGLFVALGAAVVLAAIAATVFALHKLGAAEEAVNDALQRQINLLEQIRDIPENELRNQVRIAATKLAEAEADLSEAIGKVNEVSRAFGKEAVKNETLTKKFRDAVSKAKDEFLAAEAALALFTQSTSLNIETQKDLIDSLRNQLGHWTELRDGLVAGTAEHMFAAAMVLELARQLGFTITMLERAEAAQEGLADATEDTADATRKLIDAMADLTKVQLGTTAKKIATDLKNLEDQLFAGLITAEEFRAAWEERMEFAAGAAVVQADIDIRTRIIEKLIPGLAKLEKEAKGAKTALELAADAFENWVQDRLIQTIEAFVRKGERGVSALRKEFKLLDEIWERDTIPFLKRLGVEFPVMFREMADKIQLELMRATDEVEQGIGGLLGLLIARRLSEGTLDVVQGGSPGIGLGRDPDQRIIIDTMNIEIGVGAQITAGEIEQSVGDALRANLQTQSAG